jgi:hypothetical protein
MGRARFGLSEPADNKMAEQSPVDSFKDMSGWGFRECTRRHLNHIYSVFSSFTST